MREIIKLILQLFKMIAEEWKKAEREKDYEERQRERKESAKDPAGAFAGKFGDGVLHSMPSKTDASKADKTGEPDGV